MNTQYKPHYVLAYQLPQSEASRKAEVYASCAVFLPDINVDVLGELCLPLEESDAEVFVDLEAAARNETSRVKSTEAHAVSGFTAKLQELQQSIEYDANDISDKDTTPFVPTIKSLETATIQYEFLTRHHAIDSGTWHGLLHDESEGESKGESKAKS